MGAAEHPRAEPDERMADAARRAARMEAALAEADLDAAVLASEANFTYVTGYTTPTWAITARPMAAVIEPDRCTAIVGSADAAALGTLAPHVDVVAYIDPTPRRLGELVLSDFGASVVELVLQTLQGRAVRRLAAELTVPSASGLGHDGLARLAGRLNAELLDVAPWTWGLRQIKTEYEAARMRRVGAALGRLYELFADRATAGMTERELHGALMGAAAEVDVDRIGFSLVIIGEERTEHGSPGERVLEPGDLLYVDTGLVRDGYWADFSRHFACADVREDHAAAYARIVDAVRAGRAAVRVGNRAADVAAAISATLPRSQGSGLSSIGRLGHGVGLDLTEPPSVAAVDDTPLVPGMALAVEPLASFGFGSLMAEENVLVTDGEPRLLSPPFPAELPVLSR